MHLFGSIIRTFVLLKVSQPLINLNLVLFYVLQSQLLRLWVESFATFFISLHFSLTVIMDVFSILNLLLLTLNPELIEVFHVCQIISLRCHRIDFLQFFVQLLLLISNNRWGTLFHDWNPSVSLDLLMVSYLAKEALHIDVLVILNRIGTIIELFKGGSVVVKGKLCHSWHHVYAKLIVATHERLVLVDQVFADCGLLLVFALLIKLIDTVDHLVKLVCFDNFRGTRI